MVVDGHRRKHAQVRTLPSCTATKRMGLGFGGNARNRDIEAGVLRPQTPCVGAVSALSAPRRLRRGRRNEGRRTTDGTAEWCGRCGVRKKEAKCVTIFAWKHVHTSHFHKEIYGTHRALRPNMLNFVNLTPHVITIRYSGMDMKVPPSGSVARVTTHAGDLTLRGGFPCPVALAPHYGDVEYLPRPQANTVYIVSGIVLARCCGRDDVFGPGTGPNDEAVRDEHGQVVAVTRLIAAPAAP